MLWGRGHCIRCASVMGWAFTCCRSAEPEADMLLCNAAAKGLVPLGTSHPLHAQRHAHARRPAELEADACLCSMGI